MLSTIILNYNTRELTAEAVRSVQACVPDVSMEIIVFDNGSVDNSVEYLRQRFPDIKLIESDRNLGFARAVNRAVTAAKGEYIWLVNSDCAVREDAAFVLLDYIKDNPEVAIVAGRLSHPDGSFQGSCRHFPTYSNILFSRGSPLSRFTSGRDSYTLPDYANPTEVDTCALANAVIRREHFLKVGGFDERFFIYLEDTDLCKRLSEHGYKVVYHPAAESIHHWGVSFHGNLVQRYFRHHISVGKYFRKHFEHNNFENAFLELTLGLWLGLRCVFALLRGRV